MTIRSWLMYLMLVLVATSVPGPAVLYITTKSTLYGWRKAMFAALGNITGLFCLGLIAITGLGTILKTSEVIFDIVKYAGAVYLVYLGVRMIFQKDINFDSLKNQLTPNNFPSRKIYFQALGVALSNPKAIVFLTALFPQFIDTQHPLVSQFSILITVLMFFSFSFLMSYALLAHKVKGWLTKSGKITIMNKAGGAIFIGFGILLAASRK